MISVLVPPPVHQNHVPDVKAEGGCSRKTLRGIFCTYHACFASRCAADDVLISVGVPNHFVAENGLRIVQAASKAKSSFCPCRTFASDHDAPLSRVSYMPCKLRMPVPGDEPGRLQCPPSQHAAMLNLPSLRTRVRERVRSRISTISELFTIFGRSKGPFFTPVGGLRTHYFFASLVDFPPTCVQIGDAHSRRQS